MRFVETRWNIAVTVDLPEDNLNWLCVFVSIIVTINIHVHLPTVANNSVTAMLERKLHVIPGSGAYVLPRSFPLARPLRTGPGEAGGHAALLGRSYILHASPMRYRQRTACEWQPPATSICQWRLPNPPWSSRTLAKVRQKGGTHP
jgi:hypothetical protein